MRVLVTGGAGYIGSHTCKTLAEKGHTPVTVDNLSRGHEWAVKWGPLYKADIRDSEAITKIIRSEKVEAVIHFAAYAYVGESLAEPLKYYDNNVGGTLSLLKAMRDTGVSRFVLSSTCATYGIPATTPIEENFEQNPINPYGRTKLVSERILKDFAAPFSLSSIALRYFNACGADPGLEIGEDHQPETHLIPLCLDVVTGRKPFVTVFGDKHPTRDGTCIRDFIHVSDLANAHVLALQNLSRPGFEAYNLGTGKGFSVKEVIDQVAKTTGKKIESKIGEARAGDPPVLVASGKKAELELKWKPQNSELDQIISTAYQWHEKHFGGRP